MQHAAAPPGSSHMLGNLSDSAEAPTTGYPESTPIVKCNALGSQMHGDFAKESQTKAAGALACNKARTP